MPSKTDHREFVVLANEPGRHAFDIVGPFATEEEADAFLTRNKLSRLPSGRDAKPLISPEDWVRQDARYDDQTKELES